MAQKKAKAPEAHVDTDAQVDEALREMEAELKAERTAAAAAATPSEPAAEPVFEAEMPAAPAAERPSGAGLRAGASKLIDWVDSVVPGNRNAAIGAVVGLICAIAFFVLGFWRMLACAVFVLAGVAVGQLLDGDPKIIRAIKKLLDRRDRD